MSSTPIISGTWRTAPETRLVCDAFAQAAVDVYFVGGCVRNDILKQPVSDIDLATPATPREVLELAAKAGLKTVPTGLDHGTVTIVASGVGFEVTTFREDSNHTGRHADVHFGTDMAADASRRDFTMNALYARPDGTMLDPLGGLPDLRARRVRFVGDPAARIAEDYLRILRFFRFFAWYGDAETGLDEAGYRACIAAQTGLARLSRERVGAEMRKLLAAPNPAPALAAMDKGGLLGAVLQGADGNGFERSISVETENDASPDWRRRLAMLGWQDEWSGDLRLSKAETRHLQAIRDSIALPAAVAAYHHGPDVARSARLIADASSQTTNPDLEAELARGAAARFPVAASDLSQTGAVLGQELRRLEALWIASDFTLSKADLLKLGTR